MVRNYGDLSPFDFECLIRDLFQARNESDRFEVFAPGPDEGVDVRLLRAQERNIYIQCKHYPNGPFASVHRAAKNEAVKVRKAIQGEYWFVTSASLTAGNKRTISNAFVPGFLPESQVLSRQDIDNWLNVYPGVEERNYKLYMTSAPVLRRLLNAESLFRQEGLLFDVRQRVRTYVQTPALAEAREILKTWHTCIISGEPGIGKTALAEMIVLSLVDDGFECHPVSQDVIEAERLFRHDVRQVFLYDDFLGQTSLNEKLNKNEDARLTQFMLRMEREPNHFLILTTREYILRQAAQTYEKLGERSVAVKKYILDLKSYNKLHRAHILYNNLYYSGLSNEAMASVVKDKMYRKIVSHRNYNPRLIELTIRFARLGSSTVWDGSRFASFFLDSLDNPSELWRHAFEMQISAAARDLLVVLASFPDQVMASDLLDSVVRFQEADRGVSENHSRLMYALDEVDGVFVSTMRDALDQRSTYVGLSNPSFRDYLQTHLGRNSSTVRSLVVSVAFFEQLEVIYNWVTIKSGQDQVVMPGVRRVLLEDGALIFNRMGDLLDAHPLRAPFFADLFSGYRKSELQRALWICRASREEGVSLSSMLYAKMPGSVQNARESGKIRTYNKAAALSLIDLLDNEVPSECREQWEHFVASVISWFEETLETPDDFTHLRDIYAYLGDSKVEEVAADFVGFLVAYKGRLVDDPERVESGIEEIRVVADELGVDVDEVIAEINEMSPEEEGGEDYDLEVDRLREERTGRVSYDREIDDLFGTLG